MTQPHVQPDFNNVREPRWETAWLSSVTSSTTCNDDKVFSKPPNGGIICERVLDNRNRFSKQMSGWFRGGWSGPRRRDDLRSFLVGSIDFDSTEWNDDLRSALFHLLDFTSRVKIPWHHPTYLLHDSGLLASVGIYYLVLQRVFHWVLFMFVLHPYSACYGTQLTGMSLCYKCIF